MDKLCTLVIVTAVLAVSEAANIEKGYISPFNTRKSRGLFSSFGSIGIKSPAVPSGGYTNDDLGVVVDAVAPGTRTSGVEPTGLGGPRTSYGSLNSKVGDAAFKVGGGPIQGTASGITSLFGPSEDPKAHIGFPGIGFGSGSSSLGVVGKKTTGSQVPGFDLSKTTYETIESTDGDVALGVQNAAVKGGATGSGSSHANVGLPGIGFGSGSSSLDASGIKATDAKVGGFGLSKTTYETIHSTDGDVGLGVDNVAIKSGATGSGSSHANVGLPGIGFGSGSSSLDASGIEATDAKVGGFGLSKTTYETIHSTDGDVGLGAQNVAIKGGATGSASILSSSSSHGNLGLPGFGIGSKSSSLDVVEKKANGAQVTGFGVSKTTYESTHSIDENVALGVQNAAVKGGATGSGSIFNSGSGQANVGVPGIDIGTGTSSLDASEIEATNSKVAGFGKAKTTNSSILSTSGDATLNTEKASVKGGIIGVGSIFGSGKSQEANIGLSGTGTVSGSSSLEASRVKDAEVTGLGISKTSFGSINSKGEDAALNIGNEEVKGGSVGVSSLFKTSSGQEAKIGLTGIGDVPASGALDISGKVTNSKVTGYSAPKSTYGSLDSTGGDAALKLDKAAVKGGTSIFGSGIGQVGSGISSSEPVKGSEGVKIQIQKVDTKAAINSEGDASGVYSIFGSGSSQKANVPKASLALGISSSRTVEEHEKDKIHAQNFANKVALSADGDVSGVATRFSGSSSQKANAGLPSVGVVSGISSPGSVEGYEHDKVHAQNFAHNVGLRTKGSASEIASVFGSSKKIEPELPSFGLGSGIISSGTVEGYKNDKIPAQKFASNEALSAKLDVSGVSSVIGSGSSQKANTGVPNIGPLPAPAHVHDGSYSVQQNNNDKSDYSKCNGEETGKLSINIGDSILKTNLGQGSAALEGSIGNGQSSSSVGQSIEKNIDSFGLNGHTETQKKQELLYGVGKSGVKGGFQATSSYGINQESTLDKTQHFGVHAEKHGESNIDNHQSSVSASASTSSVGPNPGQQVTSSIKGNDGISATFGSGITYEFNTGNFNPAWQKSKDSKFGSYYLTNPFYPGYKVIDNRHKLSGYEGVKFSTNSYPLKAGPLVNFSELHSPIKNAFNLDTPIISPQYRQQQGLTSSHYNDTINTQTYVPTFKSAFHKFYTNFGELSSNQGSFSSNENQDSRSHKSTYLLDQKPLVQSQLNEKSSEFSSLQTQVGSGSGSQFGKIPESTRAISHTFPIVDQKSTVTSQTSSTNEKLHFGLTPSSLTSTKSVATHSSASSYNGGAKAKSVQISQLSVKPFDSLQNSGSGFSQTQFGSTFGSQSALNSQKVAGFIFSTTSQAQRISQKDVKQLGSQNSYKYSQQSQYSSTSGSQFGKKSDTAGTISHTFPIVGQKTLVTSQTSSSNEKPHFDLTSSSLTSTKSEATHRSASSYNGGVKDQSVQISQSNVKPFDSSQSSGSGFSQTQFGSTFGSQSGLNSQKVAGSISSTTSQVKQSPQKDVKQLGSQDSYKYSQQSQYSSTSGSQFGRKSEAAGTISQTFPIVGQKTIITSQTSSSNEKPHFGLTSSSLTSTKSVATQGSASSYDGGAKDQSVQTSQSSVKPFGSSQSSGSGFSQTQFGSTFGSQSGLNSQKVAGFISSTTSQVQQSPRKDVKQLGSQDSYKYFQQSQYSSTSGSQFGRKSEAADTISQTFPIVGQKTIVTSQTSSSNEKPHFGLTSSSLTSSKSVATHSSASSYNGGAKDQSVQTSQSSVKPFGSSQSSGLGFSQTQFGSTFGSQSGLNSQKVAGSISSTTSQLQQSPQKDVKQLGTQDSYKYSQQSQYSSTSGSQFGRKSEAAGTISQTFPIVGQKTIVTSQTSSSNEKPHFGLTSSSLTSSKSVATHSSASSYNGGAKDQSVQTSQSSVKPFGSSQSSGSGFSQTQFGSTFGSQSGLNSQKVAGSISSTTSQVQQNPQKDVKQLGPQDSYKYSQQSQYSSTSGSQFGRKSEAAGTISQTFPIVGQKTKVTSQTSFSNEKPHFGLTSSSLTSSKSVATHSSASSYNGGAKDQSVQTPQSSVKPFGSSQSSGLGFSQTQFGSTFGSQSGLNSQKVAGSISSTISQLQQSPQKDVKQLGPQDSYKYSQQSQYSSTSGSQFGRKSEAAGTISQTFPIVGQKTKVTSQTSSSNEKPHFGLTSSSLTSSKSVATHSSASSYNGGAKDQSVQTSQSSVKPFGSSQSSGLGFSQTQFGSTFGSQSGLNSQKVAGSISSTTSQLQQSPQKDVKQLGTQDSYKYSQQSQYSSTSGSQFGRKSEAAGTISQTFPIVGQKTIVTSQTSSSNEKPHFGLTSSSLTSSKSVATHSSASSYNGGAKDQSVQTSQSSVKPFGSSQSSRSGFSQTQFGSTFGSQSGLNSQKVAGSISSTTSQVQQSPRKDVKQLGPQDSYKYSQQSQYSSTSGSQFGRKSEAAGTISQTFPIVGQKTIVTSQTGSSNEKPHFGLTSSSLTSTKSVATQGSASSYNGGAKDQSLQISQSNVKPFGSSQSSGSSFSQTQFGSTFGSQSGLNSQKVAGSISSTTSQVQQSPRKDVKQLGSQDSYKYSQQSQYSSTSGSQFGRKSEAAGTISQTFPIVGQKTIVTSQTSSSNEKPHFGLTSSSLTSTKSVATHSSASSYNGGAKDQSVQLSQSNVKPFGSSQSSGSGFSQTQFGSTFGSQSGLNSQKVSGSISSTTSQVQQSPRKDVKQLGSQDSYKYSQQSQYSSTSGSQFGRKSEAADTISQTFPIVGQKTIVTSQTSSSNEKPHFGLTSSSLTSTKSVATHSSASSYNGGAKDQSVQLSQSNVKPFGSSQSLGSGSSQTQFGSTFGSQSGLNSQKVAGFISSTTSQVQQSPRKDVKQLGSQDSYKYSQQSQYSSTSGSQFGRKSEAAGTISQTFPIVGQKTIVTSQTSSSNEKPHFGLTSSSLTSTKSVATHSSASSYNGGAKDQSVQLSQSNVKPFGSSQSSGSGFSQTQFGSTFGSQSGLNSQKVAGSISSTTSQVQQSPRKDVKQLGSQDSYKYSQQSQYSSTSGSQFGRKSEVAGTISQTFPIVGQKTIVTSQTSTSNEKPHFGLTSSLLTSSNSVATHTSTSSYKGGAKDQSVQLSQSNVKPFGSSQSSGSGFSQTQFGSTFGSQSGLNSQKVAGFISSTNSQVRQSPQKVVKQLGSQDSYKYSQQSQYSSTSGSQFGRKSETAGTISHTFPIVGQKTLVTTQTSSSNEKPHFGLTFSSLTSSKSVATHSSASSYNGGAKDQSVQLSQSNVKPFGSSQSSGSGFSQTQFGSTFGSQSGLNSQKVAGSIFSSTSQVQQSPQKDVKQLGPQDSYKYSQQSQYSSTSGSQFGRKSQQSQYSSTSGSQFGRKSEAAGTISQTFPIVGQKTLVTTSSYNGGAKDQSVQTSQSSVKPFGSSQSSGSGFSQTQFGSTFGSQSGLNSKKVAGSVFSTTSQVQQSPQKDVKQLGSQENYKYFQQSQYSSTSGSQFGRKSEAAGIISQTFPIVGQKTLVTSQTSSSNEKPHFGLTSSSLTSTKSVATQGSASSYNSGAKDQFVQTSQSSAKSFGSSQSSGSGFSQTQFGSSFGSQSGLNTQKVAGSISSTTSQVKQSPQKVVKQLGSQDSYKYFQQSQYSSTSGSQFGMKPELTPTTSYTFSGVDQKKTGSGNEKSLFGFSTTSLNSEKSGSTQSISSSFNGKSKGQYVQSSQVNLKPLGSSQSLGSRPSQAEVVQTQDGNSQKVLGSFHSVLVQPISEYRKKPFSSQSDYNTYQQFSSSTGTEVGSSPKSNSSHISTAVGQKSLETPQTGSGNLNTYISKSVSSSLIKKSESTESNSFSVSSFLQGQAKQTTQLGSKTFVYPQTTGSSFSKTLLGGRFSPTYDKQSFGRHYGSHQDTLLGVVTGSQGLSGQIHSVKPYSFSRVTGSGFQQPQLSFSLRDLLNHKPQSSFTKSFSQSYTSQGYNTANKPLDSIHTPLHIHSGVGIGHNHESSAGASANSGSISNTQTGHVSKYQTTNFGIKDLQPFGGSLTQTVHKQTKVFGVTPSTDLLSVAHSIFDQSVSKSSNTISGAQIPISFTEKSSELSSFVGKGETFGGPRDPPSFDIKTGYHY